MSKFNIGNKVVSKGYPYLGEEVGVIVGLDLKEEGINGKYLVKFDSLSISEGWAYRDFSDDHNCIIEPYKGYAQWVEGDDLVKVEDGCKEKKEIIKNMDVRVSQLTLEIKEIKHEMEKIKKEWHID